MTAPTAEERARLRELAREKDPRRVGICEEHWHASRIMELRGALLRATDALDTAERERDNWKASKVRASEDYAAALEASKEHRARIAALEAEVAAAKDELSILRDAVDKYKDDLARVTAHHVGAMSSATYWHDAQKETAELYNRARERADANAEALARVTGELAEAKEQVAAERRAVIREDDLREALATAQRDREKLQGERDAARVHIQRLIDGVGACITEPACGRCWYCDAKHWLATARREAGLT